MVRPRSARRSVIGSTSCAPVATIGPREAVQPISAFYGICDIGLSALPVKERGAPLLAAAIRRARAAGSWRDENHELQAAANERIRTASQIDIALRCIGRRIVPRTPLIAPNRRTEERDATV